ncbi:MAG: efflux RND transporter permease subunit [Verrucomicrobiales bacterium]
MIEKIISWSLANRFLVFVGSAFLFVAGLFSVYTTPVDAIPDLSENQVIVFADWMGRSPQEVEDQVTYPLSANLQGLAGVKTVRAVSMFGFSLITVIFHDNVDNYFARSRVLERLNYLGDVLPAGVTPKLGPDATGLGWVYQYYLEVDPSKVPSGEGYDLGKLRSIQDWFIRYQLNSVQGVAEVASLGGFVQQYQIEISSSKMRAAQVSMTDVLEAVQQGNLNIGGKVIEENGMEFVVRGLGLVQSIADVENIAVKVVDNTPVYIKDVATVEIGGDFRRGALDVDGNEVVGGIVVMRTGQNAKEVIRAVKEKIEQISPSLPPGISIKSFYDRSRLIDRTIETLKRALTEELILVTLAHIIFLWHFRSIIVVTLPLPLSILVSFIMMRQFGVSSNIMSLCGIAIAIGVLVDAAIVLTENVIRQCELAEEKKAEALKQISPPGKKIAYADYRLTAKETYAITKESSMQVGRPIFFAMLIIILAFVPVFALQGQERKLFHPLAFTKTFAMIGATLLAITLVPALCTLLVRGPFHAEKDNILMKQLLRLYDPALNWALRWKKTVLALAGALLMGSLVLAFGLPSAWLKNIEKAGFPGFARATSGMGSEFMPALNEESLLLMPVLLPSISLPEVNRIMSWQDKVIKATPEVISSAGKLGRAETATDPAPIEMIETTIMLKPQSEWRPGMTHEMLVAELTEKLTQVPGYVPGFLQPIEARVLMISTGIRAQLGVKILGSNLDEMQMVMHQVEQIVRDVPGAIGVAPSRVLGKPYLEIQVDRQAIGRHGLSVQAVLDAVETGIGGKTMSTTIKGRERLPIQVRLDRTERDDIERVRDILIATPAGAHIPLGQLTSINRSLGPSEIASENGLLRLFVQSNVQNRDLGSFVQEVRDRVSRELQLPRGITIEYSGEYENQIRAQRTLLIIVPTVLFLIFLLLYLVYRNVKEAAHVILAVPFALTGGVLLQYLLGYNFSVAVWVGYIALFGTAIQTGVVMVVYLEEALEKKRAEMGAAFSYQHLIEAIQEGARLRLRPKVMTVATTVASLLPIMWSTQTGSEVLKPLATPVIGGMISSLIHILIVTPVIFALLRQRELTHQK